MMLTDCGTKRSSDEVHNKPLQFIPGLTLSQHPPEQRKDLFLMKLKDVMKAKSLHPTEFEGYTLKERFAKMGWEQLLNFECDKIYRRVVIQWTASLSRSGDELTGIVDGKPYTITPTIIRDLLKVDTRTDLPYVQFKEADLQTTTDENKRRWMEACRTVFGTHEDLKEAPNGYERNKMTPLVQIMWRIGVWTFHPRIEDLYFVKAREIYLLHALVTGDYLYSFAHLMIDDIWDMYEQEHKNYIPHGYYISLILNKLGAVSKDESVEIVPSMFRLISRDSFFPDLKFSEYDSMARVICSSPEYNPQAIVNYLSCDNKPGRCSDPHVKNLIMKAKNHLSAIGWTLFYDIKKRGTRELRYKAPGLKGKVYLSLKTACECAIKNQDQEKSKKKSQSFSCFDDRPWKKVRIEDVKSLCFDQKSDSDSSAIKNQDQEKSKRKYDSFSCVDDRPQKKVRIEDVKSLCFDQKIDRDSSVVESEFENERFSCNRLLKQILKTGKNVLARKDQVSSTKKQGILGSLIENSIVKRGARVSYLSRNDGRVLARGRVYEDGIKCNCCNEMFLLTKFERHAGSTYNRPAANLFFDDNRSILDCQTQLELENILPADDNSTKSDVTDIKSPKSSDCVTSTACACRLCNLTSEGDSKNHDLIKCVQCERHFHISCISKLGFVLCIDDPARWLCTDNCERMYLGRSYGMKVEM